VVTFDIALHGKIFHEMEYKLGQGQELQVHLRMGELN